MNALNTTGAGEENYSCKNKTPPQLNFMKNIILSEYQECVLLAEYLDILQAQGKVQMYTHIPNETYTKSWAQKMKNKRQGVSRGVPDYLILLQDKCIFIEMKRARGGILSPEQKQWISAIGLTGATAYVCNGFDEAKKVIDNL